VISLSSATANAIHVAQNSCTLIIGTNTLDFTNHEFQDPLARNQNAAKIFIPANSAGRYAEVMLSSVKITGLGGLGERLRPERQNRLLRNLKNSYPPFLPA